MQSPPVAHVTSLDELIARIEAIRKAPAQRHDLVSLLAESAPVYAGRGSNEVDRLRGYVLASFEATGLPPDALPYVYEELESGQSPYTVAAAARALRGCDAPSENVVPLIVQAIERLRSLDQGVRFDSYPAIMIDRAPTTALSELVRTLAWLGPRARAALGGLRSLAELSAGGVSAAVRAEIERAIDAIEGGGSPSPVACCAASAPALRAASAVAADAAEEIDELELQDQDAASITFGAFFHARPSVMAFFYTRCMNPEKCSLTVTKLARLQQRICKQGLHGRVNVAALTYDPAYDLPQRLYAYGADRGMVFDARNRMLRTTGPLAPLRRRFDLGVGYGAVTVNRHRLELFVLDRSGRVAAAFTRTQWREDDVLGALTAAAPA